MTRRVRWRGLTGLLTLPLRIARRLLWLVVFVFALLASLVVHLRLPLARRVARTELAAFVSGEIRGTLLVGEITQLSARHAEVRDVLVLDPKGRKVIAAKHVELDVDLRAALRATLRFSRAEASGVSVRLIETVQGLPSLLEAFEPARISANPDAPGLHAVVDAIHVRDATVHGDVLGLHGLRVEHLDARGRLETWKTLEVDLASVRGRAVRPYSFPIDVDSATGRIVSDPHRGIRFLVHAHTPRDRVTLRLRSAVPRERDERGTRTLDLRIEASPASPETLRELGFTWAERIGVAASGNVHIFIDGETTSLEGALTSEAGDVTLRVRGNAAGTELAADTTGIDLERALLGGPRLRIGGHADVAFAPATSPDAPSELQVSLQPFVYDHWAVPALTAHGLVYRDRIVIDGVHSHAPGSRAHGHATVWLDGRVEAAIRAEFAEISRDPNIHRLAPGVRGQLTANAAFSVDARSQIAFRGQVRLAHTTIGPLVADDLVLQGSGRGDARHPALRSRVTGHGVRIGGYLLGAADVTLDGGPRTYAVVGRFTAPPNRRAELDAQVTWDNGAYIVDASRVELAVGELVWRGAVSRLRLDFGTSYAVDRLRLANGPQRFEARGVYRPRGTTELDAQLQNFDLNAVRVALARDLPDFAGRADAHLQLHGPLARPEISLQGALREGRFFGIDGITSAYAVSYEAGIVSTDVEVDLPDGSTAAVALTGHVDAREPDPIVALERGHYEGDLTMQDVQLPLLQRLRPLGVDVSGHVSGMMHVDGTLTQPTFRGQVELERLSVDGSTPIAVILRTDAAPARWDVALDLADAHGELGAVEVSVGAGARAVFDLGPALQRELPRFPWRLAVRFAPRTLASLPSPIGPRIDVPLRVTGSLTAVHEADRVTADGNGALEWVGGFQGLDCGHAERWHAAWNASLRDGLATGVVNGFVGNDAVAVLTAWTRVPLLDWMRTGTATITSSQARLVFGGVSLARLPVACRAGAGPVNGTIEAHGLFTDHPLLRAELRSPAVQVEEAEPFALDVHAEVDRTRLLANLAVDHGGREPSAIRAQIPWHWEPTFGPDGSQPLEIAADFHNFHLAPLLVFIPSTADADAVANGTLRAAGTFDTLSFSGETQLSAGHVELVGLGQRLTDIHGGLRFDEHTVHLDGITATDGDGTITFDGPTRFHGIRPEHVDYALTFDKFPARREGSLLATVTGNASLSAAIQTRGIDGELQVRQLSVRLPESAARTLQSLDAHPDIVVLGEEQEEVSSSDAYPISLRVAAPTPFWVRRNDLAVLVTANLDVRYRDPAFTVGGYANLPRGFYEVVGKRFEIERGSLNFDGSTTINPAVDLVATHSLRCGADQKVYVRVTGTLLAPEVEFSTNVTSVPQDTGSIIGLLLNCRGEGLATSASGSTLLDTSTDLAQRQAAAILGVIATTLVQQNLGEIVPVFSIETGDQQRVRAGFQADWIIPSFLRDIVRSAYVEGVYTTRSNTGGTETTRAGIGFLIELQFPYNLVFTGNFTPPTNWGADVIWQP